MIIIKRYTENEKKVILQEHFDSGLNVPEFASKKSINTSTMYKWLQNHTNTNKSFVPVLRDIVNEITGPTINQNRLKQTPSSVNINSVILKLHDFELTFDVSILKTVIGILK